MFLNFASLFSVDIIVKISIYLLLPVYLNLMTQAEFGVYNYLLSFVIISSGLLSFGQNIAQSKLYFDGNNEQERGEILFSIASVWAVMFLVGFALIVIFNIDTFVANALFNNSFDYLPYRKTALMAVTITIINGMLFNFLVISKQIRKVQIFNLSKLLLINILSIGAMFYFSDKSVAVRLLFTYLSELFVLLFFAKYLFSAFKLRFNLKTAKKALAIGLPITLASLPAYGITIADKYFINKYYGINDLSVFYLAFTISSVLPMVFYSFNNVLSPEIFKEKDLLKNLKRTGKILLVLELVFVLIAVGLWFSIFVLLKFDLINVNYTESLKLLPILLAGQIISIVTALLSIFLIHFEKTYFHTLFAFALFLPSVAITYFLTSKFGNTGAAFAFLFNALLAALVFGTVVFRIVKTKLSFNSNASTL